MAYNLKKQAGKKKPMKKMAKGGMADESANTEVRPSPEEHDKDSHEVSRNSGDKPSRHDGALDRSTVAQAQSNNGRKVNPIKHPRMVPSSVFSTKLQGQEDDLMELGSQDRQEEGPDRHGPDADSLDMKMMAEGGKVKHSEYMNEIKRSQGRGVNAQSPHREAGVSEAGRHVRNGETERAKETMRGPLYDNRQIKPKLKGLAEGGMVDNPDHAPQSKMHPDLLRRAKIEHEKMRKNKNGFNPTDEDNARVRKEIASQHKYAEGGEVSAHDEMQMDHEDSIAAAIMAKKELPAASMSDSDMDEMQRLYKGGEVNGMDSMESDDSDMADLSRNAEEDANMEDQASFDALRKENYSESEGLEQLDSPEDSNEHGHKIDSDKHDMAEKISRRIAARRQFKQR